MADNIIVASAIIGDINLAYDTLQKNFIKISSYMIFAAKERELMFTIPIPQGAVTIAFSNVEYDEKDLKSIKMKMALRVNNKQLSLREFFETLINLRSGRSFITFYLATFDNHVKNKLGFPLVTALQQIVNGETLFKESLQKVYEVIDHLERNVQSGMGGGGGGGLPPAQQPSSEITSWIPPPIQKMLQSPAEQDDPFKKGDIESIEQEMPQGAPPPTGVEKEGEAEKKKPTKEIKEQEEEDVSAAEGQEAEPETPEEEEREEEWEPEEEGEEEGEGGSGATSPSKKKGKGKEKGESTEETEEGSESIPEEGEETPEEEGPEEKAAEEGKEGKELGTEEKTGEGVKEPSETAGETKESEKKGKPGEQKEETKESGETATGKPSKGSAAGSQKKPKAGELSPEEIEAFTKDIEDIDQLLKKIQAAPSGSRFGEYIDLPQEKLKELLAKIAKQCEGSNEPECLEKMKEIAKAILLKMDKHDDAKAYKFIDSLEALLEGEKGMELAEFARKYAGELGKQGGTNKELLDALIGRLQGKEKVEGVKQLLPTLLSRQLDDEQTKKFNAILESFLGENPKIDPELDKLLTKAMVKISGKLGQQDVQENIAKRLKELKAGLSSPDNRAFWKAFNELEGLALKSTKQIDPEILAIVSDRVKQFDAKVKGNMDLLDPDAVDRLKQADAMPVSPLDLGYDRIVKIKEQLRAREEASASINLKRKAKGVTPSAVTEVIPVPKKLDTLVKKLKELGYSMDVISKTEDTTEFSLTMEGKKIRVYCVFDMKNAKLYVGEVEIVNLTTLSTYFP